MAKESKKNNAKSKPSSDDIRNKIKNFDALKRDYELIEENLTVLGILRKLSEHLELYLKIIQQILQPEEFHSLYECAIFDDKEKSMLLELYKRIIITHREILKAEIKNNEKDALATIQYVDEEIKAVKPEMLDIVKKMQDSWKKDVKKDSQRYFG